MIEVNLDCLADILLSISFTVKLLFPRYFHTVLFERMTFCAVYIMRGELCSTFLKGNIYVDCLEFGWEVCPFSPIYLVIQSFIYSSMYS